MTLFHSQTRRHMIKLSIVEVWSPYLVMTQNFVLLLLSYWVNWADLQCKVQMEHWDGSIPDINGTCADLFQKYFQLLDMHALSGYDTSSFPWRKGRVSSLNTKVSGNYQCLATIDGVGRTHTVDECSNAFSLLHYTVSKQEHPWNLLATIYSKRRREIVKRWLYLKTSANLTQQYILGLILTLKAPIATKVVCFSRLLKCLRSLYGKQCGPRSDCSYRSSLFWVHAVCLYT